MTRSLPLVGDANFLGDPDWALYTVVFVVSWQYVPFHTLLYQGAARQVPASLYEAATIDGAGGFQQFLRITLPQLRYTVVTSSILMPVGSLTTFDTVLILTNGGPGAATRILPLYIYDTGFTGSARPGPRPPRRARLGPSDRDGIAAAARWVNVNLTWTVPRGTVVAVMPACGTPHLGHGRRIGHDRGGAAEVLVQPEYVP